MDRQARTDETMHRLVVALDVRDRGDGRLSRGPRRVRARSTARSPSRRSRPLSDVHACSSSARAHRRYADRSPPSQSAPPRSAPLGCWGALRRAARASSIAAPSAGRARPPRRGERKNQRDGSATACPSLRSRRRSRAYSRIVSSIPKRGSPPAMCSVRSRLLLRSDSTESTISSTRRRRPPGRRQA